MKVKMYALRADRDTGYMTYISDTLKNLQSFVGDYIETVTLFDDLVIICNEEGRIRGLEKSCTILGHDFYGPVLISGVKGAEFADVPLEINELRKALGVK